MLEATAYTTGPLNQYTAIERGEESVFEPVYDADGNQTLIRTSTGIWQVAYNAENRPVRFVNESAKTGGGMHLRLHGQAAHPQSERQRDGEQLPALHVPWLPANSRHRCRQRSLPMVPVLGPDAA